MKLNRGFTLIELLVMLTVLGILMAITVPNITGILKNQRENAIAEDVGKMVDTAKIKMSNKTNIPQLNSGQCLKFSLNYLDDNDDFKKGPNGNPYDKANSYVIAKREGKKIRYYVKLIEKEDGYTVGLIDYADFEKDPHSNINSEDKTSNPCSSYIKQF